MGKLTVILLGALAASPLAAVAQTAPASKPPAAAGSPAAQPDPKAPLASRHAGTDLPAYVEVLADQFSIRRRTTDPFCQPQDPNAKVAVKPTVATKQTRRAVTAEPPTPLSAVVKQIEITTVMPRDKRFLIGERRLGQGDKLTLTFQNKPIPTRITEVSSRRIVFTNTDTGEIGIRELDMLPQGMTPGTRGIVTPGMVPVNSDAPLEIGSSSPPP